MSENDENDEENFERNGNEENEENEENKDNDVIDKQPKTKDTSPNKKRGKNISTTTQTKMIKIYTKNKGSKEDFFKDSFIIETMNEYQKNESQIWSSQCSNQN